MNTSNADSKPYLNVIKYQENPKGRTLIDSSSNLPAPAERSATQIESQNANLRKLIERLKQENAKRVTQQVLPQNGVPVQFDKRLRSNAAKIEELKGVISQQQTVIKTYQAKFDQFESNLQNVMKLDKDIHSKLVNPTVSTTLEKNVKNVLTALNGKAPYDKLLKMIETIQV